MPGMVLFAAYARTHSSSLYALSQEKWAFAPARNTIVYSHHTSRPVKEDAGTELPESSNEAGVPDKAIPGNQKDPSRE